MARTLYLHIGAHRTATSSIQEFLQANFDALLGQGVFHPYGVARHNDLMKKIFSGARKVEDIARTLDSRATQRNPAIDRITLSDEDISMREDLTALAAFREHFDVKILFSLRRQDLWLESWYRQNVKWQWDPLLAHCSFNDFMARRETFHWIDYDAFLKKLEALFGRENILLSVFEKSQMPGGPVAEFCRRIGIEDRSGFTDPPHANASVSGEVTEFMRHLPLDLLDTPTRVAVQRELLRLDQDFLEHSDARSDLLLDRPAREAVMQRYAAGNRAVAQRYFDREELFLEDLPPADAPLARLRLPEDSGTLIEQYVGPLLLLLAEAGALSGASKDA